MPQKSNVIGVLKLGSKSVKVKSIANLVQGLSVRVAVGTVFSDRPPLRSPRAALPHKALISDEWRRSEFEATDGVHAVAGAIEPPVVASVSS